MGIITGQVNSGGGREIGKGFNPQRNQTGDYTVKFDQPFKNLPIIVATGVQSGAERVVTVYASSESEFSVTTRKNDDRRDSSFNFYATDDYLIQ